MASMRVTYEWDIESFDENGDVHDHHHADRLADLPEPGTDERLVLVRDASRDWDLYGLEDRQWAYVVDGKLPAEFDGGAKVPQQLRREFDDARPKRG